jgi:hypothetical protein
MLITKLNIKTHEQSITYKHILNNDINIVFDILFKIDYDINGHRMLFHIADSQIYLQKEKNKFHIKHNIISNKIIIDGMSLWIVLYLWLPAHAGNIDFLHGLIIDKITIEISE